MKIICKETTAKNLDLVEVTTIFSIERNFNLVLEKEYVVMGIAVYKDSPCLHYLIDEDGWPRWYPFPLFDVSNPKIPDDWYVEVFAKKNNPGTLHFLCGFYELCCNEDFYDALMDREAWAMELYFKRKREAQGDIF